MGYYGNHRSAQQSELYLELPEETRKKLEKENPREEVTQTLGTSSSSMTSLIKEAKEFAEKWGKTINDVRLEHSTYQHEYSDYWSSEHSFEVEGLETDEQYYSRLAKKYENQQLAEKRDREEFERLKTKFK